MTTRYHIDGGVDLATALRQAFDALKERGAKECWLSFDPSVRFQRESAQLLREGIHRAGIRKIVLQHQSPSLGFVISTLSLLCPKVDIVAARGTATDPPDPPESEPRLSAVGDSSSQPSDRPTNPITQPKRAVERVTGDGPQSGVAAAFERLAAQGVAECELHFETSTRLDRAMVDAISAGLEGNRAILVLTVVHDSASVGFIASTVALRCPWANVQGFRSAAASQRPTPGPAKPSKRRDS